MHISIIIYLFIKINKMYCTKALIVAAIFSLTKAGLSDTYAEKDFEEWYTSPLSNTRYPNNTMSYAVQFD